MISAFFIGLQSRGPAYRRGDCVPTSPTSPAPAAARSPPPNEPASVRARSGSFSRFGGARRATTTGAPRRPSPAARSRSFSRFGSPRRPPAGKPDRRAPTSSAGSASWTGSLSCFSTVSSGARSRSGGLRRGGGAGASSGVARSTWSDLSCFTDSSAALSPPAGGRARAEAAAAGSPARRPRVQMPSVERLNAADADAVAGWMLLCCGSPLFALRMCGRRPFASEAHLLAAADDVWRGLRAEERAAAAAAHPRLGARLPEARTLEQRWRTAEHAALTVADPEVRDRLEELNDEYFVRFGTVFVMCTRGKSAQNVIDAMEGRLRNSRWRERRVAEKEQLKFTKIRLERLLRSEVETGGGGTGE